MKALINIQNELKAPKSQFNAFGKYRYRNQEDILEEVKPLLLKYNCCLTIWDEVKEIGNIIYIEATAEIFDGETTQSVTAQAGIDINTKGMSISQCFGSSSSYARKYALNGLFLIDDTKDADSANNAAEAKPEPKLSKLQVNVAEHLKVCSDITEIQVLWDSLETEEQKECKAMFTKRRFEIQPK